MRLKRIVAVIVGCAALSGASAAQASIPGPALRAEGHTLKWTAVPNATRYRLYGIEDTNARLSYVTTALSATPAEVVGHTVRWKVKSMRPVASKWSNSVGITYTAGESQKEKEEREAREKAEREQKEREEHERIEREEREAREKAERERIEREAKEKEEREKEAKGEAGRVKIRLDAKSFADSVPIEWFKKLARVMAYPPAGDRYPKAGIPTLAYHDAWTTWGSSGATHKAEYDAWASRDNGVGYLGQFMDDINFQGGNVAGTRAQYRELIESVRATIGPSKVIEINAQFWNIWPLIQAKDPNVLKALEYVNVVTKEFNVSPTAGINSPTKYREFFEYTDFLVGKAIHIVMTGNSSYNTSADKEYSLATYYLLNDGGDFIGFSEQKPGNEYAGLQLDIGGATSGRERSSSGVWKRSFAKGVAYTVEPGAATQTITLAKPMKRLDGTTVSSVTLAGAHGAVLQF